MQLTVPRKYNLRGVVNTRRSIVRQFVMSSSGSNSVVIEVLMTSDCRRHNDSRSLRRRLDNFLDQQDCKEDIVFQGDTVLQVTFV